MDEVARRRNYPDVAAKGEKKEKKERTSTFRFPKKLALLSFSLSFSLSFLSRFFAFFFLEILPASVCCLTHPRFVSLFTLCLIPSGSPFPFLLFLLMRPTEINDSEILIQWQGCRREVGSRLSFLHALRLPVFPTRATHPVFLLHKQPAKLKGSFFSGRPRYKSRMKKTRTLRRLKWRRLLNRDNDDARKEGRQISK